MDRAAHLRVRFDGFASRTIVVTSAADAAARCEVAALAAEGAGRPAVADIFYAMARRIRSGLREGTEVSGDETALAQWELEQPRADRGGRGRGRYRSGR